MIGQAVEGVAVGTSDEIGPARATVEATAFVVIVLLSLGHDYDLCSCGERRKMEVRGLLFRALLQRKRKGKMMGYGEGKTSLQQQQ